MREMKAASCFQLGTTHLLWMPVTRKMHQLSFFLRQKETQPIGGGNLKVHVDHSSHGMRRLVDGFGQDLAFRFESQSRQWHCLTGMFVLVDQRSGLKDGQQVWQLGNHSGMK